MRYDYSSPPVDSEDRANLYDVDTGALVAVGTNGMPRGGYEPDRNNIAPRLGFAWTANAEATMAVRGGYGIYYNQGALATSEGLYFNPPYFNLNVYFPIAGVRGGPRLDDPFPADFPIAIPQSATAYQRDLQTPWMEHWNLTLQRSLGRTRSLEVSYVGSRGHDLISARDVNQPPASPSPFNFRPNPSFADITLIESRASSRYNALQLRYHHRAEAGLSILTTYTYGKSTDNASGFFASTGDPNFPQNSLDPDAEESRSSFDIRHKVSAAFSFPLPIGDGRRWLSDGLVGKILSEMEVHGVYLLTSGRPFTVAMLPTIDVSNTGRSNLGFGYNDRPNVTGDATLSKPTPEQWFNTGAFSFPEFGTFGNAPRNMLQGPSYKNVNLALVKNTLFGLQRRLQLRMEVFNILNRSNFDLPDAFLGSPTFGQILSAGSPRRFQFGVKYTF